MNNNYIITSTFIINMDNFTLKIKKMPIFTRYAIALTNITHKSNLIQNLDELAKKTLTCALKYLVIGKA